MFCECGRLSGRSWAAVALFSGRRWTPNLNSAKPKENSCNWWPTCTTPGSDPPASLRASITGQHHPLCSSSGDAVQWTKMLGEWRQARGLMWGWTSRCLWMIECSRGSWLPSSRTSEPPLFSFLAGRSRDTVGISSSCPAVFRPRVR